MFESEKSRNKGKGKEMRWFPYFWTFLDQENQYTFHLQSGCKTIPDFLFSDENSLHEPFRGCQASLHGLLYLQGSDASIFPRHFLNHPGPLYPE